MTRLFRPLCLVPLLAPVAVLAAQGSAAPPAVHPLGAVVSRSPVHFGTVSQIVPLGDGRIMVADRTKRVVTMLDSTLASPSVVLDSVAGRQNTFSANSFLLPFRGDSSLFFDAAPAVFVVIDPGGKLGRVMAAPPTWTGLSLASVALTYGTPFLTLGPGLLYKTRVAGGVRLTPTQPGETVRYADSNLVVWVDLVSRDMDSVAKVSAGNVTTTTRLAAGTSGSSVPGLFPYYDDAVVTSDGSTAIFHAQDFRLEWIDPSGKIRTPGARMPFPWQPISDALRQHLLDSVNTRRAAVYDSVVAQRAADSAKSGSPPMIKATFFGPDAAPTERMIPAPPPRSPVLAVPEEIPNYYPPTGRGAVMADADNNVWIRPSTVDPATQGVIWNVYNHANQVIDRVLVPEGHTVVGFGKGGVVYLITRDAAVTTLEKARVK